jgi:hypothetical protein
VPAASVRSLRTRLMAVEQEVKLWLLKEIPREGDL